MSEEIEPHIYRKFEIQQKLGKGAYGVVWKAIEKKTGQVVALKKVFEAFQNSTDAQRTFREVMILQEINGHENIVKLLNVIKAENKKDLYLVFEFMETDLHAVIKAGILTPIHKQYIIFQILKGLKYIHSGEIVHRDLKPSNVLINTECLIKIADFGLARSVAVKGDDGDPIMTEYVATRWYRAPEIVLGSNKYSKAVDVWSVGCILAELINGKALFPGKSTLNQVELILEVLGKPSEKDLQGLNLESTLNIIKNIRLKSNKSFEEFFRTDDKLALDFLKKSLTFNHRDRLTIEEALEHPFLENFRESDEYHVLNKVVEIPIDENTRFSTSVYQEALYNEIIRKKKEQRRKWKEEYLKSLRLETREKADSQNQATKKESKHVQRPKRDSRQKKPTKAADEPQETEKKHTGGTQTELQPDSPPESVLISKESPKKPQPKESLAADKQRSTRNEDAAENEPAREKGEKRSPAYTKEEPRRDKRSETPMMFGRKKSPAKEGSVHVKKTRDPMKEAFKRRKSTYDKAKARDKRADSRAEQYQKAKKHFRKKEELRAAKKEKALKKIPKHKNTSSTGKSMSSFTSKRGPLKYSRGLLTNNLKKNSGSKNFQALFASKNKGKDSGMGGGNFMMYSRKQAQSKTRQARDLRKAKGSPKGSNPYIKPSGSRHSDILFNQNAMTRFHPPNYGVYANERQRFVSRFEGVYKSGTQDKKDAFKKSSHDKGKFAKHYSSLNAYEKNFYRGGARDKKGNTLYSGHLKPKRSHKIGSSQKEKHGTAKLTKFRSREKVSGGPAMGFSYRNVPQSHSQFDNSLSRNIYEDNLYSGLGPSKHKKAPFAGGGSKRTIGGLLGGHMFVKSKHKSRKNMKRSPLRGQAKLGARHEFKRSEDAWNQAKEAKEHLGSVGWNGKQKRAGREGLQEWDRNRRRQTRDELENKVSMMCRNLMKQEKG